MRDCSESVEVSSSCTTPSDAFAQISELCTMLVITEENSALPLGSICATILKALKMSQYSGDTYVMAARCVGHILDRFSASIGLHRASMNVLSKCLRSVFTLIDRSSASISSTLTFDQTAKRELVEELLNCLTLCYQSVVSFASDMPSVELQLDFCEFVLRDFPSRVSVQAVRHCIVLARMGVLVCNAAHRYRMETMLRRELLGLREQDVNFEWDERLRVVTEGLLTLHVWCRQVDAPASSLGVLERFDATHTARHTPASRTRRNSPGSKDTGQHAIPSSAKTVQRGQMLHENTRYKPHTCGPNSSTKSYKTEGEEGSGAVNNCVGASRAASSNPVSRPPSYRTTPRRTVAVSCGGEDGTGTCYTRPPRTGAEVIDVPRIDDIMCDICAQVCASSTAETRKELILACATAIVCEEGRDAVSLCQSCTQTQPSSLPSSSFSSSSSSSRRRLLHVLVELLQRSDRSNAMKPFANPFQRKPRCASNEDEEEDTIKTYTTLQWVLPSVQWSALVLVATLCGARVPMQHDYLWTWRGEDGIFYRYSRADRARLTEAFMHARTEVTISEGRHVVNMATLTDRRVRAAMTQVRVQFQPIPCVSYFTGRILYPANALEDASHPRHPPSSHSDGHDCLSLADTRGQSDAVCGELRRVLRSMSFGGTPIARLAKMVYLFVVCQGEPAANEETRAAFRNVVAEQSTTALESLAERLICRDERWAMVLMDSGVVDALLTGSTQHIAIPPTPRTSAYTGSRTFSSLPLLSRHHSTLTATSSTRQQRRSDATRAAAASVATAAMPRRDTAHYRDYDIPKDDSRLCVGTPHCYSGKSSTDSVTNTTSATATAVTSNTRIHSSHRMRHRVDDSEGEDSDGVRRTSESSSFGRRDRVRQSPVIERICAIQAVAGTGNRSPGVPPLCCSVTRSRSPSLAALTLPASTTTTGTGVTECADARLDRDNRTQSTIDGRGSSMHMVPQVQLPNWSTMSYIDCVQLLEWFMIDADTSPRTRLPGSACMVSGTLDCHNNSASSGKGSMCVADCPAVVVPSVADVRLLERWLQAGMMPSRAKVHTLPGEEGVTRVYEDEPQITKHTSKWTNSEDRSSRSNISNTGGGARCEKSQDRLTSAMVMLILRELQQLSMSSRSQELMHRVSTEGAMWLSICPPSTHVKSQRTGDGGSGSSHDCHETSSAPSAAHRCVDALVPLSSSSSAFAMARDDTAYSLSPASRRDNGEPQLPPQQRLNELLPVEAPPYCPGGHVCRLYQGLNWRCDRCGQRTAYAAWSCRACDYDLCYTCTEVLMHRLHVNVTATAADVLHAWQQLQRESANVVEGAKTATRKRSRCAKDAQQHDTPPLPTTTAITTISSRDIVSTGEDTEAKELVLYTAHRIISSATTAAALRHLTIHCAAVGGVCECGVPCPDAAYTNIHASSSNNRDQDCIVDASDKCTQDFYSNCTSVHDMALRVLLRHTAVALAADVAVRHAMVEAIESCAADVVLHGVSALPPLLRAVVAELSSLWPLSLKRDLCHFLCVDSRRYALGAIQDAGPTLRGAVTGSVHSNGLARKVKVYRHDMARTMQELYAFFVTLPSLREKVEFAFDGEEGTGNGPTQELYTELSRHFMAEKSLWFIRSEEEGEGVACVLLPFPSCTAVFDREFFVLGALCARAFVDGYMMSVDWMPLTWSMMLRCGSSLERSQLYSSTPRDAMSTSSLPYSCALPTALAGQLSHVCWTVFAQLEPQLAQSLASLCTLSEGQLDAAGIENADGVVVTSQTVGVYVKDMIESRLACGLRNLQAMRRGIESVMDVDTCWMLSDVEMTRLLLGASGDVDSEDDADESADRNIDDASEDERTRARCGRKGRLFSEQELREAVVEAHGYQTDSPVVAMFVSIIGGEFTRRQQSYFLEFLTGSSRMPVNGLAGLGRKITVVKKDLEDAKEGTLPSCNTCFLYFKLPPYSSQDIMRQRLLLAISEGRRNFSLS